jgi:hypothetical protein
VDDVRTIDVEDDVVGGTGGSGFACHALNYAKGV